MSWSSSGAPVDAGIQQCVQAGAPPVVGTDGGKRTQITGTVRLARGVPTIEEQLVAARRGGDCLKTATESDRSMLTDVETPNAAQFLCCRRPESPIK
jgi:hypothetical protein